jgi:hypothetical protein
MALNAALDEPASCARTDQPKAYVGFPYCASAIKSRDYARKNRRERTSEFLESQLQGEPKNTLNNKA